MSRTMRVTALLLLTALLAAALAGCGGTPKAEVEKNEKALKVTIGTLPTEDTLPFWVAEQKGYFKDLGLEVGIETFQSAQERDVALSAGKIDGFMGDIIAATALEAGGVPVSIVTVMLGATPQEGRFGVVAAPKATYSSLKQLANVPVGTSSDTIQEYVLDGLMSEAGVPQAQVKKAEVKKVPVRFELLMSGKLQAAALPEPFLTLAQAQGGKLLADDTKGKNLSQTVLVMSKKYLDTEEGREAVKQLMKAWDKGAEAVNADPNAYRSLLVEKARLPKPIESTYKINTYPKNQLPTQEEVEAVLTWMKSKGYLTKDITYSELVWQP